MVAIACATLFYSHQFIPERSERYNIAQNEYKSLKKEKDKILIDLIETTKGTDIYRKFKESRKNTYLAWDNYQKVKKEEKVLGFQSIRYFIERFGLMLCIFMYALYNLIKSYLREPKNIGAKFIHTFIISITFFYFYWIFQQFQDVSRFTYYFMTVFSAILVTLAVYLITKYNKDRITKLRQQLLKVSLHSLRNVRPEKEQETFTMLKEIAHDK
ncbi:hypothetical protein [Tenacibaculum sp. 190524A02b]|uniref:hypothetical protein n=1 Tax=Tenacibaculum vairaonense TaxID=3137860 RepID=UPI0031FB95B8